MKNIPVLTVEGRTLAEAYERALVALYREGVPMATQYDKPGDPPSLDSTMNITVLDPLAEPMIHKAFPGRHRGPAGVRAWSCRAPRTTGSRT